MDATHRYLFSWTGGDSDSAGMTAPCGTNEAPKSFASVSCMWPLFATGLSPFATPAQKRYIHDRLNCISETMGIKPAAAFAKVSRQSISVSSLSSF